MNYPELKNTIQKTDTARLKYGYVTVEYTNNSDKPFEMTDILRYFGFENVKSEDKVVVEFEYNSLNPNKLLVYDVELVDCPELIPVYDKEQRKYPISFVHKCNATTDLQSGGKTEQCQEKSGDKIYSCENPVSSIEGKLILPLSGVFLQYTNYDKQKLLGSRYNCIYSYKNNTIFSLAKIKDTNTRMNFIVAYNNQHINDEQCAFILKHMFY